MKTRPIRLALSLGIGVAAVSCASVFIRFAQARGMDILAIAAWRLIFACTVLLPYAWSTHRREIGVLSRGQWKLLALAGVFLGLHFAAWIVSLAYTSVASSAVLVAMGPAFVGLGSWLFMGERPRHKTTVGIVLASLGSVIIGWGDMELGPRQLLGDGLALAGAVCIAGYLMIGRRVRVQCSLVTYITPVYGVAMLTLLGIVLVKQQPMLGFHPAAYGWALALGLIPQLIGHTTLNWALHHLTATFVAIVTLAEPIGAGFLAYWILGEKITLSTGVGGVLVLAGIYVASRSELRHRLLPVA
ncbi:MAG: DMT family transporter [Phycisphaerae bacterium]|nr:DMT family transporter [Phycisphaerae bacterium]